MLLQGFAEIDCVPQRKRLDAVFLQHHKNLRVV
jgi:hypothetical protein